MLIFTFIFDKIWFTMSSHYIAYGGKKHIILDSKQTLTWLQFVFSVCPTSLCLRGLYHLYKQNEIFRDNLYIFTTTFEQYFNKYTLINLIYLYKYLKKYINPQILSWLIYVKLLTLEYLILISYIFYLYCDIISKIK